MIDGWWLMISRFVEPVSRSDGIFDFLAIPAKQVSGMGNRKNKDELKKDTIWIKENETKKLYVLLGILLFSVVAAHADITMIDD